MAAAVELASRRSGRRCRSARSGSASPSGGRRAGRPSRRWRPGSRSRCGRRTAAATSALPACGVLGQQRAVRRGARVVAAVVAERRVDVGVDLVRAAGERLEAHVDQQRVARRVGDVGLDDPVAPGLRRVDLAVGEAVLVDQLDVLGGRVGLAIGEGLAVGDDELQVAQRRRARGRGSRPRSARRPAACARPCSASSSTCRSPACSAGVQNALAPGAPGAVELGAAPAAAGATAAMARATNAADRPRRQHDVGRMDRFLPTWTSSRYPPSRAINRWRGRRHCAASARGGGATGGSRARRGATSVGAERASSAKPPRGG